MGTETFVSTITISTISKQVKLNNPLMGTETEELPYGYYNSSSDWVKLNNPLMGTETLIKLTEPLLTNLAPC